MVTEIFEDVLYCPEAGGNDEFLSPDALKHRIILSTKQPKEYLESKLDSGEEELFGVEETPSDLKNGTATEEVVS